MKLITIEETNKNIRDTRSKIELLLKFEKREQVKKELETMLNEIEAMESGMMTRFGTRKGYF